MPYYDYRCSDCNRPNRFFYSFSDYVSAEPTCTHCASSNLKRRIGRVAVAKGDEARTDALIDNSMLAALEDEDPRTMGKFMREMSQESGESFGDEFGEAVDRLEKGQSFEEVEKAMPDIGTDTP